ncbi:hypothetical protein GCM10029963_28680 [Micromonospora andamanensis]|uniref:hypothetical protein n=1 Tax=Micromonospora andamanensis TaxID=1287068 RepID=UPI001950CE91|nr:hypothetical protein [Micromonospora andamanensis]GIJ38497.1 hypothetical protein Vwe01_18220 [Micromonospora andamanensis]
MKLNAIVRGQSMTELIDNSNAICEQFYGVTPWVLTNQPWDTAQAEFDSNNVLTGFLYTMTADRAGQTTP